MISHRDTEMKKKNDETAEPNLVELLFSVSPCLCG